MSATRSNQPGCSRTAVIGWSRANSKIWGNFLPIRTATRLIPLAGSGDLRRPAAIAWNTRSRRGIFCAMICRFWMPEADTKFGQGAEWTNR